jgi:hypothetical protein
LICSVVLIDIAQQWYIIHVHPPFYLKNGKKGKHVTKRDGMKEVEIRFAVLF